MIKPMEHLTRQQISFCDNAGLAGILLGLCCLIQHLFFMIPGWITVTIILIYLLSIIGFFLLMKRSEKAPLLLLISGILLFIQEAFMILAGVYSLALLFFLIYVVVIVVLIYTSPLPKKLKLQAAAIKAEREEWNGKV